MVAGLVNTGAMKQKLTFRLLGAIVGGLVLGLSAEVFLFPFMDFHHLIGRRDWHGRVFLCVGRRRTAI